MLRADIRKSRDGFTLAAAFALAPPVRVLGVVGPSGSGKSTLLSCLAGAMNPDAGRITFDGQDWFGGQTNRPVSIGARRVGYVFQDGLLFDHMTVGANLRYGCRRARGGPTVDDVANILGIRHLLNRRATDVSGGERRRVALGRALLSGPQLLLLDEPLTGLDPPAAGRVLVYLRRLIDRYALPTVFVSHAMSDVLFLCDRAMALDRGRIVHHGDAASLLSVRSCADPAALSSLRSILDARIVESDEAMESVTYETAAGLRISALGAGLVGDAMGVAIDARDVVIATQRPGRISARNIYPGRVHRLVRAAGMALVEIDIGERLWAEVGYASAAELELSPGREIFAYFKASAVQRLN